MFKQKGLSFPSLKVWLILPLLLTVLMAGTKLFPRFTYQMLAALRLANTNSQHYQLVESGIEDGDSLRVTDGNKEVNIQLCGVDAPELGQELGTDAREHLKKLALQGQGHIILVSAGPSGNGQTLAEVFVPTGNGDEEIHLNSQMLADGMAYLYPKNLDSCSNGGRFAIAEDIAKQTSLGIWARPLEQKPWEYRANR